MCNDHSKKKEIIKSDTVPHRVCDKCFGSGDEPLPDVLALAEELKAKAVIAPATGTKDTLGLSEGMAIASRALGGAGTALKGAVDSVMTKPAEAAPLTPEEEAEKAEAERVKAEAERAKAEADKAKAAADKAADDGEAEEREAMWVPDEAATTCFICSQPFGVMKRRHHCRKCGNVVCGENLTKKEVLPRLHPTKEYKVCDKCFGSGESPTTVVIAHGKEVS